MNRIGSVRIERFVRTRRSGKIRCDPHRPTSAAPPKSEGSLFDAGFAYQRPVNRILSNVTGNSALRRAVTDWRGFRLNV